MINFDVNDKTGVQFETIMSMQQLSTQLYQQDLAIQQQLVPQGGQVVSAQPIGGNQ